MAVVATAVATGVRLAPGDLVGTAARSVLRRRHRHASAVVPARGARACTRAGASIAHGASDVVTLHGHAGQSLRAAVAVRVTTPRSPACSCRSFRTRVLLAKPRRRGG